MFVISRQRDETIMIGDDIEVTVVDIRGDKVRLGIVSPKEMSVHRKEVYDAIRRELGFAASVLPQPTATRTAPVAKPDVAIRPATAKDLPAINDIYNHYVLHSTCTYQEEPSTMDERSAWFKAHGPHHPVTVATEFGEVVGWASISKFHQRSAYGRTVENSVYVRHDLHRRGIGRALLVDLIERAKGAGHHTIMALIDRDQAGSVAIHRSFGFKEVGCLREVGHKFNRWLDVVYMQKMLT